MLTRRLHLFDAKFGPHPLLYKDMYNLSIKQLEREKLSVEQLKRKLTPYLSEPPVLTAHKDSHIENMRTDAISDFHIWLKMRHTKRTDIYTLILHITGILHQMPENKERSFVGEMPPHITAGGVIPT